MFELGFITSSRIKQAHFEHLGRAFGIQVYGFKKLTYWGSYDEPHAEDRDVILRESYTSALKKWRESGQSEDKFFFFEDTSVKIDALSTIRETPGVAVKFWMQETSFKDLDRLIGDHRRASVRSDIVLHLPKSVKAYLKSQDSYYVTHGSISGVVADVPSKLLRAPALYPWLDPKSFSGWFIPDGAEQVLSDLPIHLADGFDFRYAAFQSMVNLLRRLRVRDIATEDAPRISQQSLFKLPPREIVILCGHSCAGKTSAAQALTKDGRALHLEASDFMRTAMIDRLGPGSVVPVQEFAEHALKEQPWIVPEQILSFILKMPESHFVISGLRSLAEVEILRKGVPESRFDMFNIGASENERYRRSAARKRGDPLTREEYHLECDRQSAMGLGLIASSTMFKHVNNSGSLSEWLRVSSRLVSFCDLPGSGSLKSLSATNILTSLQIRSIMALGAQSDGDRYYTSGEISKLMNDSHGTDIVTANDNVSRFLNQSAYPYFEPQDLGPKGIGWRLSNTGLSIYRILSGKSVESYRRLRPSY